MALPPRYRAYASTFSQFESLQIVPSEDEIHVVLAFARDYDSRGNNTLGVFRPYFKTTDVTPDDIANFRQKASSPVKFFLSIGGRSPSYPFSIGGKEMNLWINNAVDSLTGIINWYKFDGIDVYYEHIKSGDLFAAALSEVIGRLRDQNVITRVSLTVSAPVVEWYDQLLMESQKYINHMIFQIYTWPQRVKAVPELLSFIKERRAGGPDEITFFAGHSVLPADWATVPLPVFLALVPLLFNDGIGISEWTVTSYDLEQ